MSQNDWWETVFDQKYLDTYLANLTPEKTEKEIDFVIKAAQLKPEDHILDLACGHGRHSIELAKRGFGHVTGLDYSKPFIAKAKADASQAGIDIRFMEGDMKNLPFDNEFDAVLLLFTAFGYFDDEANRSVLKQIHRALKPGGKFLIDVISGEAVISRFNHEGAPDEETGLSKIQRHENMGGQMVDEVEWFDRSSQVIHSHREWQDKGQKKEYDYWLHVYTMPQYDQMLRDAGFELIYSWGDYEGQPHLAQGSVRTIILAQKHLQAERA
jgi:ubiquinone/menaquinone biosynthesis C-methylase UbiE